MKVDIEKILGKLKSYYGKHRFDVENRRDPFRTLVSCILSLRTKDAVTFKAADRLFKKVKNVKDLKNIDLDELAGTIYPVGFYKTKAANLKGIANDLIENYGGRVPDEIDELLKLKGVGRKTANLVVSLGYGKDGICVDTHVHRISNRFGYIKSKDPFDTEMKLRSKLPKRFWKIINYVLVLHGQNICKPINPACHVCPVAALCAKKGVKKKGKM